MLTIIKLTLLASYMLAPGDYLEKQYSFPQQPFASMEECTDAGRRLISSKLLTKNIRDSYVVVCEEVK